MAQEGGLQPRRRRDPVLRQASPLEEIRLSCLKGKLESVERIIEAGIASVDEVFEDGWTALMVASNGAHPQIVKFLLDKNASPNIRRADGFSCLMAALTSSQKEEGRVDAVVELLVKGGAEINVQNKSGLSPLLLAVKDNRIPAIKFLISNGADVNSKDKDGRSPLFHAAERGLIDAAQLLLGKGADKNTADNGGRSPSEIARIKGHTQLADIIQPLNSNVSTNSDNVSMKLSNVNSKESDKLESKAISEPLSLPSPATEIKAGSEVIPAKVAKELPTFPKPKEELKIDTSDTLIQRSITKPPVIEPVAKKVSLPEPVPIVSTNLHKDSTGKAVNEKAAKPKEFNSSEKGEKKNFLAMGLAFGVGVGVLILYYVRVYYLKRN